MSDDLRPLELLRTRQIPKRRWCGRADQLGFCVRYYDWGTTCAHESAARAALAKAMDRLDGLR